MMSLQYDWSALAFYLFSYFTLNRCPYAKFTGRKACLPSYLLECIDKLPLLYSTGESNTCQHFDHSSSEFLVEKYIRFDKIIKLLP